MAADSGAPLHSNNEDAHVSSTAEASKDDDLEFLRVAVRKLPPQAVEDLLSNGVCTRCIFRLFFLHEQICSRAFLETRILSAMLQELRECEDGGDGSDRETKDLIGAEEEFKVCRVCLGILQFLYTDDKGILVRKNHIGDFAAAVGDVVKQEGHQVDNFSLEVSLPPTVLENEQAVRSYIEKKYSSESWFSKMFPAESIAVKDFLKLSVANPLESFLDVKSNGNSFRIRLTYTLPDASANNQPMPESNGCSKRRKIDDSDVLKKCAGLHEVEKLELTKNSSTELGDDGSGFVAFPLEKTSKCCSLMVQCYKTSIYVGGRYLKYSRNVSQSRWIIDDERMGEASVEEILGGNILPICQGDSYKFHAAGREDIDVRMLGTGRPFLVEIQNARQFPSNALIKDMETKINSRERKLVRVKNLKFLGSQGWELMREGEAEKQKQYTALVWTSRPLTNDDEQLLSSPKDMQIMQKTPIRVLHRRSPLGREKTIHWMRIERIAGNAQYFLLHLCTQAGTYIKEFVHGDLGRTNPSVGSILGCRAEILQLDVTDVKMDCFQVLPGPSVFSFQHQISFRRSVRLRNFFLSFPQYNALFILKTLRSFFHVWSFMAQLQSLKGVTAQKTHHTHPHPHPHPHFSSIQNIRFVSPSMPKPSFIVFGGGSLNYRDLDLEVNGEGNTSYEQGRVWGVPYFGNNFDRLVRVKSWVDPGNFFTNEQYLKA